jgi:acyl-CoA dehydrogenase
MSVSFQLSDEQAALRELAHDFAKSEIRPVAAHHDVTGDYPWEVLKKAHAQGLLNTHVPTEYGGLGLGALDGVVLAEELAWGCTGIGTAMEANGLAQQPVILGASDMLKRRYLAPMTEELQMCAYAVTEPGAGSDVQGMRTSAVKKGDKYVINGQKMWITNGGVCEWYFCVALTDPQKKAKGGMSAFIVPRSTPGITVGAKEQNMGQRASDTRAITFDEVEVPADHLVGREGDGWMLAMAAFDYTRASVAAAAVGLAKAAMDYAIQYSQERQAFGGPIANHQAISFLIAEMAMNIDAGRLLCWQAAQLRDAGLRNTMQSSMAKAFCADMAMKIATDAVQIYGGYGYSKEYPVEKPMRDAKIFQIYEGTSQIQRLIIARELMVRGR